ncbi:MAG: Ger(x)C family spore germination protein [Betaproteobacteria bacterium]
MGLEGRNRRRGWQKAGAVLALTFLVAGCWDYREPNQIAFVEAVAVDRGRAGEVEATVLVDVPHMPAGGGTGGDSGGAERSWVLRRASGQSLDEALARMTRFTGRTLNLSQCRVVLFSDAVARRGLGRYLDLLARASEFRPTLVVAVTRGRAERVLSVKPQLERSPADLLVGLLSSGQFFGSTVNFQLLDLITQLTTLEREAVIPLVAPKKPEPEGIEPPALRGGAQGGSGGQAQASTADIVGLAVFRKDRLVGQIDPADVGYFLMLSGRQRNSFLSLPDPQVPGRRVTVLIRRVAREVRVRRSPRPEIRVQLQVPLEIREIQSTVNYTGSAHRPILEAAAARHIAAGCRHVLDQAQKAWRADVFSFGTLFKLHFLTWPEWVRFGWPDRFPQAQVRVAVEARVVRSGTTLQPGKVLGGHGGRGQSGVNRGQR